MKADERRNAIAAFLSAKDRAVAGGVLAAEFGVSRQIIVQDIAALKNAGYDILSTRHGYLIHKTPLVEQVFKVFHTTEETEDELNCVVDLGGTVVDVFVWHKVYGRIDAKLNISTRDDVQQFLEGVRSGKSSELMNVTGGYHYHTVRADSEDTLYRIAKALAEKNYIAPEI